MRLRADALDVGADVENRRNDAERMEQAARAAVFAIDLLIAELLRNAPILFPQIKTVADFDGNDAERRLMQGVLSGGRGGKRIRKVALFKILPRHCFHAAQFFGVNVVQHDGRARQDSAFENIA